MRTSPARGLPFRTIVLTLILAAGAVPGFAQVGSAERGLTAAFEYPGIEILQGESFSLGFLLKNRGDADETVELAVVEKAAGWTTALESSGLTVTGVYLPAGESKTLTFRADPPLNPKPGRYVFRVRVAGPGGAPRGEQALSVTVREKREQTRGTTGLSVTTSFPVLRGASDAGFEFSLELENRLGEDAVFDLFAQGPERWEINFKPAYEPRYISSFQLKARENRKLSVEVKPPTGAPAGEYPIQVRISSGATYAETTLTVVLTGTYDLSMTTVSGSLSLGAVQGKPATVRLVVKNTGTAVQSHVGLLAFNPENWKVEFRPEKVDNLAPGQGQPVDLVILPYEKALVGDYSVEIRANGEKVSKPVELRVTVNASTLFGWIGVAIIILVVGGLAALFRWLGRR